MAFAARPSVSLTEHEVGEGLGGFSTFFSTLLWNNINVRHRWQHG